MPVMKIKEGEAMICNCDCKLDIRTFGDLQDLGLAMLLVVCVLAISFGLAYLTSRLTR